MKAHDGYMLGTDLDSATHKLRVSDDFPPVWDTFCQVDFSYTSYGFVILLCSISSQQQSATLSG